MTLNLGILLPEWIALGALLVMLTGEIVSGQGAWRWNRAIARASSVVILIVLLFFKGTKTQAFGGMFVLDSFAVTFKILLTAAVFFILPMCRGLGAAHGNRPEAFHLVLWTALIGMFFLVSSRDFLLLFVSLEIVTLSFYIMTAWLKRSLLSIEAGLKYLVLGSLASAFLVFGIGLVYTASGAVTFEAVAAFFRANPRAPLMILGLLFMISGLGFKMAAVPFQLWVPDVYQGAPTPVTAFLAVGSKSAGVAVLLRVLTEVFPGWADQRMLLFGVLSALTLLYGNFAALPQTNIKRLFGYSSIAHAGYLLMGLACGAPQGSSAVLFYLMAYIPANLAAFWVITLVGEASGNDEIASYRGLARRSPVLAAVFFTALLSLAGVPPLAGFFAKFLILFAAVRSGLGALALFGALLVAVSLFYYLSIVRRMYLEEPENPSKIEVPFDTRALLVVLAAALLLLGFIQAPFLAQAVRSLPGLG
ncbi:MAG: NADH-quinone oxidoreductase subunit N [Candidatus Omnitrophota bacterium]|jgi:NADH-quinone oxidoreductase subunit N